MIPLVILSIYLLTRFIFKLKTTEEFFLAIKFNSLAAILLATQYFIDSLYMKFIFAMSIYCLWLLVAGTQFPDGAFLMMALAHAIFHDEFLLHENILFNVTVDDLLHGIMFLFVCGLYKKPRVSGLLRVIGGVNMLVAYLSLDLKYTNYCNEWIFGLAPNQIQPLTVGCGYWFGGYGGVATVIMAVGAISGMLVLHDSNLTADTLFWEMLPYFITSTSYYFVYEPLWVIDLYDKIKYDQLYFMLPSLYHLTVPLMTKMKDLPIMAPLS